MKPANYPNMPAPVNGGYPALDPVLSTSNMMYREKGGFPPPDTTVLMEHRTAQDQMGMRFYCFYCNHVSFSEAELNAHLKQHTAKYPLRCPYCGQGYMRRLCLVKHIERLHNKDIVCAPKPGAVKAPHVPVSSALPSVPTADPASLRPFVRVKVPPPSTAYRLDKDARGKTLDAIVPNGSNGTTEPLTPSNGLIQHNRALTVSLPEDVSIPAGCLMELLEVKTVNGTKELKLRLVSQQGNESVIKDTRTTVPHTISLDKQTSSTLNHSNSSFGSCTISRKQVETKVVNAKPPTMTTSKPLQSQDQRGVKRQMPEIINLECQPDMPTKVPKNILSPVREVNSGIKVALGEAPVKHSPAVSSAPPARVTSRLTTAIHSENMGACVSQKVVDERRKLIPEHSKSIPARRESDIKSISRDAPSVTVKLEPSELRLPKDAASKIKAKTLGSNQPSLKTAPLPMSSSMTTVPQQRPPAISVCPTKVSNPPFSAPRTLSVASSFRTPTASSSLNTKVSAWRPNARAGPGDVSQPESFPVISSVFSLSQQPVDAQGSIQPLVMALRGMSPIKMDAAAEPKKESGPVAPEDEKDGSLTRELVPAGPTGEAVKRELQKDPQSCPVPTKDDSSIKEDSDSPPLTDTGTCGPSPESKASPDEDPVSKIATHEVACGTADLMRNNPKSEPNLSSKFLTVSLKRVQIGVWKKNKKRLKLRISKYKTGVPMRRGAGCIYPMPLKVDQLVKRPGPNQPVVVLNHPKPRASLQGPRADTLTNSGGPGVGPKCQILKMRLSKVMGQKYEVMGCTVRVFP